MTMWGRWLKPTVASMAQFHLAALIHWSIRSAPILFHEETKHKKNNVEEQQPGNHTFRHRKLPRTDNQTAAQRQLSPHNKWVNSKWIWASLRRCSDQVYSNCPALQ